MHEVTAAEEVSLAADKVWSVIGDFSGIKKWAPIVENESTEQTPEGKVRTLTMPGGRVVSELCTSEGPHHYTYSLKRPDLKAYFSTVSVKPGGADTSEIVLKVEFEPNTPDELGEKTEQDCKAILESDAVRKAEPGSEARKLADFYAAYTDEARVNELGAKPISPELSAVAAIKTRADLLEELAALKKVGVPGPFRLGVSTDAKNSDAHILSLSQDGLGLPDKDYYEKPRYKEKFQGYEPHVARMLELVPEWAFRDTQIVIDTPDRVFAEYKVDAWAIATQRPFRQHFFGYLRAENGRIKLLREALNMVVTARAFFPNGLADIPSVPVVEAGAGNPSRS